MESYFCSRSISLVEMKPYNTQSFIDFLDDLNAAADLFSSIITAWD